MFRSHAPVAEADEIEEGTYPRTCDDPIPLSVLGLDLPAPVEGWSVWLAGQGVAILFDDLGRRAVSREDARMLFEQQRLYEIRKVDLAHRQEQQAIRDDRERRARIWQGIPAADLPAGVSAGDAMAQAAHDAQPKRMSPMQEALSGGSMTYHSWPNEDDS